MTQQYISVPAKSIHRSKLLNLIRAASAFSGMFTKQDQTERFMTGRVLEGAEERTETSCVLVAELDPTHRHGEMISHERYRQFNLATASFVVVNNVVYEVIG